MATRKGRDLFKELIEGADAMRRHREGKLTLRRSGRLEQMQQALSA